MKRGTAHPSSRLSAAYTPMCREVALTSSWMLGRRASHEGRPQALFVQSITTASTPLCTKAAACARMLATSTLA